MKTKEQLIQLYLDNVKVIKTLQERQKSIIEELVELCPHKVGEIVKWRETGRTKNVGNFLHPQFKKLPDKDCTAVLSRVKTYFGMFDDSEDMEYHYEFKGITKSGRASLYNVHPRGDYEWTGEYLKETDL